MLVGLQPNGRSLERVADGSKHPPKGRLIGFRACSLHAAPATPAPSRLGDLATPPRDNQPPHPARHTRAEAKGSLGPRVAADVVLATSGVRCVVGSAVLEAVDRELRLLVIWDPPEVERRVRDQI
jgi:hypothetical protein